MTFLKNISLQRRLTLIIMLITSTALLLASLAVVSYDVFTSRQAMARDLSALAGMLGENSKAALIFGDSKAATDVLAAVEAEPRIVLACIFRADGTPFARYARPGAASAPVSLPRDDGAYFLPDRLVEFRHITLGDETLGSIYIESDLQQVHERLRHYAAIVMAALLASLLLAYVLAAWLQRPISEPILGLLQAARRVSAENNYSLRVHRARNDELGLLVAGFNGMLEQIQRRDQELERQQAHLQAEVEARTAINLQLEAAKEMAEAASHAKGDFLANMSHEIRTPINGVLGMIELTLEGDLSPEQKDYLKMAKSSGESLLSIINDILDFSKVESGKLELDRIEFNLYTNIGESLRMLALRAHQRGLELTYDVDPEIPTYLLGDPGRLRQILVNLVGNAIKFTEQGEVAVDIRKEPESGDQVTLHFTVRDTGIGIAPEKQAILFQAFTQADNSTTRRYGGTGLGLAICARLVGLMGGEIWVDSKEGEGSTFHFTAQFSQISLLGEAPVLPPEAELRGIQVLVVDDNSTNRDILTATSRRWGMLPTPVSGALEALAALQAARGEGISYRVILLDANMPGMDGFRLVETMSNEGLAINSVILMLTSAGHLGEAARCQQLGISAYLLKPVLRDDLRNAILTVLGRRAAGPEAHAFPLVTRHTLRERPRPLRVLVAEDNEINQTLVVRLLQKMGHVPVLAKDGREALALATTQAFDLIFMDVQMPVMDGLETTAEIRKVESQTGVHVPIFAITARAMRGDNELCLKAGMDGYISKPVRFSDVESALATAAKMVRPGLAPPRTFEWSRGGALEKVGGDENLLRELCQIFLAESPKLMRKMEKAMAENDPVALRRAAHSLKGEVSYLSADSVFETARELERRGDANDLASVPELLRTLEAALHDLYAAMKQESGVAS